MNQTNYYYYYSRFDNYLQLLREQIHFGFVYGILCMFMSFIINFLSIQHLQLLLPYSITAILYNALIVLMCMNMENNKAYSFSHRQ